MSKNSKRISELEHIVGSMSAQIADHKKVAQERDTALGERLEKALAEVNRRLNNLTTAVSEYRVDMDARFTRHQQAVDDRMLSVQQQVNTLSRPMAPEPANVKALRAERVQLQDENLALREDLKKVDAEYRKHFDARLEGLTAVLERLDKRVTDVAEVIGKRVGALHERHNALEKRLDRVENPEGSRGNVAPAVYPWPYAHAPFPTGGASTAEAAVEAVPPVPQRGDRVRLEGAASVMGNPIENGWYDVIGQDGELFQVVVPWSKVSVKGHSDRVGWMPWVRNDSPGLKEVSHG